MPGRQLPKIETMLHEAADDILAFTAFPPAHWKNLVHQPAGTAQQGDQTPHRRGRRLPQPEAHDGWQVADRHYLSESSMALITAPSTDQQG